LPTFQAESIDTLLQPPDQPGYGKDGCTDCSASRKGRVVGGRKGVRKEGENRIERKEKERRQREGIREKERKEKKGKK
jgi:hypothetical protein